MSTKKKVIYLIEDEIEDFLKLKDIINQNEFEIYPRIDIDFKKYETLDENEKDKISNKLTIELFGKEDITRFDTRQKLFDALKNNLKSNIEKFISEISIILIDILLLPSEKDNPIENTSGSGLLKYIRSFSITNNEYWGKLVPIFIVTKTEMNELNIRETISDDLSKSTNEFFTKDIIEDASDYMISLFNSKLKYWSEYFNFQIKYFKENSKPFFDIAVISALEDEMNPFRQLLGEALETRSIGNVALKSYNILASNNTNISILTAVQKKMGMFDASYLISTILLNYNIKHIFIIGVCGGNKKDVKLCDVVIPNEIKLFSKGKITPEGLDSDFETANNNSAFYSLISESSQNILDEIKNEIGTSNDPEFEKYKKEFSNNKIELYSDTMACSDYVINMEDLLESLKVLSGKRKLISVDTESFPVIKYGEILSTISTDVIKSVMDLTENKDDKFKKVAAYISANFLFKVLDKGIFKLKNNS